MLDNVHTELDVIDSCLICVVSNSDVVLCSSYLLAPDGMSRHHCGFATLVEVHHCWADCITVLHNGDMYAGMCQLTASCSIK